MIALSVRNARRIHLAAQGLDAPSRRRARPADVVRAIERMRLLQIDTIHVVARSPYFVLFSRLGGYDPSWLDRALEEGAIFETWAHEACFAPMADYPIHRAHVAAVSKHWAISRARKKHAEERPAMDALLAHVRERGGVKTSDFERKDVGKTGGWWGWKEEKRLLEALFALGELMIARRDRFHRVYDLAERVLAAGRHGSSVHVARTAWPSAAEVRRTFVLETVRALGVTQARWIGDYFRMKPRVTDAELAPLVASGELREVAVAGWDARAYVHADHAELAANAGEIRATRSALLSPFDPVVWDRVRAREFFGFDYRIECYTPEPKRKYGYFVLPILRGDALVGRLDAKAHRDRGVFEIKALFLEPDVARTASLAADVARAVTEAAVWHGTPEVSPGRRLPKDFAPLLKRALADGATG